VSTQDDVRRIALSLPATTEDPNHFRFLVEGKAFAWSWLERVDPKRPRIENPEVIAVRVAGEIEKESLIETDPAIFFTEPHYDGYRAVLVHLAAIEVERLEPILVDAWRSRAPRRLVRDDERATGTEEQPG
jgi:hypothetical protein